MTFPRYEILCLTFSVADPKNGSINLGFIPRSGHRDPGTGFLVARVFLSTQRSHCIARQ